MLKSKSVYLCHENNLYENILHETSSLFRLKAAYIKGKKILGRGPQTPLTVQILTFFPNINLKYLIQEG